MSEAIFKFETKMEPTDYRKFLYISMFKKNKFTLLMIAVMSLGVSILISFTGSLEFSISTLVFYFILSFSISIGALLIKVERIKNRRLKTDRTGFFDYVSILEFYSDKLKVSAPNIEASNKLKYTQFYEVLESANYFMFYVNSNMAHILRKTDFKDVDMNEFRNFLNEKFEGNFKKI